MLSINRKVILLALSSLYLYSFSQKYNAHKHYISAGLTAGRQFPKSFAGGGFAGGGFYLNAFKKQSSVDFCARELISTNPLTQATLLSATFRLPLYKGLFAGIGGSHAHQIGMNHYIEHPVAASTGNHPSIVHSSGFCLESGYLFRPVFEFKKTAVYPIVITSYNHLFTLKESWSLLSVQMGLRLGFSTYR
ncbi:MAG: hypothetical protein QM534_18910 [Sediminibacterium sp.]|nr:hypothetical protein [Sediminibacterium sp.]